MPLDIATCYLLRRTSSISCSFKGFSISKNNCGITCYGGRLPLPLGSFGSGPFGLFHTIPETVLSPVLDCLRA